jgi:hypothetical protein
MEPWWNRPLPMQRLILLPLAAVGLLLFLLVRDRSLKVVDRSIVTATVVSVEPTREGGPIAARRALVLAARLDDGERVRLAVSAAASPGSGERVMLVRERLRDGSARYALNTAASMGEASPLPKP